MNHLIYEKRDGVAYLTMNRPDRRNALSPLMIVEMASAWQDFRDDADLRVAVLTGAGDKAFCAGADMKAGGATQRTSLSASMRCHIASNSSAVASSTAFIRSARSMRTYAT